MKKFSALIEDLDKLIETSYEEGVTLDDAERHAAQFLHAQLAVSRELSHADLDARMRKSGTKAVRGAVYLDIVGGTEKKPTEAAIQSMIDTNEVVNKEQDAYDKAEVQKAEYERLYEVFGNAHIYFRSIAKGKV